MKNNRLLIAGALACALPLVAIVSAASAANKERSPRGQLVHQVVMKWGNHVQEAYRANVGEWASDMGPLFANASLDTLRRAADARNFDAMNEAFLGSSPRTVSGQNALLAKSGQVSARSLGDVAADLVFVPVTPCRLFDTRLAGGQIAANATRGFDVTAVSDYSFQGGAASNCDGVGAAGSFAAAAINFTVVTPGGAGYITAFPFGGTQPLAATVNYASGDIVGNLAIVKLDQGASANELTVYSFAQTHLVADIVGYYINPQPTALQCTEVEGTVTTINANASNNVFAPACPAGYMATEIQCRPSSFSLRQAGSWSGHCNYFNEGASSATATAAARCCRVPGRL